ncbi:hypothetical protein BKA70DRAFT_1102235 [Coprinopsis sp. MPI-PUGE-AT-0042]|nr:hypothetical protein BKA70DRAFT_1102235 [Coprinopsis sp. MPI-PUGE-AT-0042]
MGLDSLPAGTVAPLSANPSQESSSPSSLSTAEPHISGHLESIPEDTDLPPPSPVLTSIESPGASGSKERKNKTQCRTEAAYDKWTNLIPSLVGPLLDYQRSTYQGPIPDVPEMLSSCSSPNSCSFSYATIKCLLLTHDSLPQILVKHGLFPTAPHQPRTALGIEVLEFFRALFERSSEATQALAHALNTYYARRGFYLYNRDDESTIEPFRRGLGYAIQWFDMLVVEVERQERDALVRALDLIKARREIAETLKHPSASKVSTAPSAKSPLDDGGHSSSSNSLSPGECARILQELCPSCFGGAMFGRASLTTARSGADIHVSIDGNFNHRHDRAAGDCPQFYKSRHLLSKAEVDLCGTRIETARTTGKQTKRRRKTDALDEAIDACEEAHESGSGSKVKTSLDKFDDGGVMGMTCCHDRPLFLANIDTAGEQQKFGVALIEHLFQYLPRQATVIVAYDVGCVLDKSRQLYDIFTEGISERLGFVTTAMHAYAHQWACQVVYAPRMRKGMGLTDGEGIKRLWARIRRLIPITRHASGRRRLWLLDRAMSAIGEDTMPGLADALNRKLKNVKKRLEIAQKRSQKRSFTKEFLCEQWKEQQLAQLSPKSQAIARVKKELDSVLNLQAEIDSTQKTLESARKALEVSDDAQSTTSSILDALDKQQQELANRAEDLYASVNVSDAFPGLKGPQLKFVRGLLMARDMKTNIRKRAIGNFFEWDRLKQASGGRDTPLGTKLHQKARTSIQKRGPALTNAIKRFNKKIDELKGLYNPDWNFPLPEKLPTDLGKLKDDPSLLTDVWITTTTEKVPLWLSDPEVRDAISSMHAHDRCAEERVRVGMEADNMCRWFRNEFLAVEVALLSETGNQISFTLMRYRNFLRVLTSRWRTELIPSHVLKFWEEGAIQDACQLLRIEPRPREYNFLEPVIAAPFLALDEAGDDPTDVGYNEWDAGAAIEDILMEDILSDVAEFGEEDEGSLENRARYCWDANDLAILQSKTARLNSACMNSGAALIKSILSASPATSQSSSRCCLFSTFDLLMVRDGTSSANMWRRASLLEYWMKPIWLLPIHRTGPSEHWVLATIQLTTGRIYLFDSLANTEQWSEDIQDIVTLVTRLVLIATHHKKDSPFPIPLDIPWDFRVLSDRPVQTTSYSCGLWVLASIGAGVKCMPYDCAIRGRHGVLPQHFT